MWIALLGLASTALAQADDAPAPKTLRVYVGTYTDGKSRGIYRTELDLASGKLAEPKLAGESSNPSFLAIAPDRRHLYAVGEDGAFRGEATGSVSAFAIDAKSGDLTPLNQESSQGSGPCYIALDRKGKNALVANYGGGSIAALPIGEGGKLGPATSAIQHKGKGSDPRRQGAPHAHSINLDPANRFAVAADLGLDKLLVYKFDPEAGLLTPNAPPATDLAPGSGPRHFAFHPDGKHAYAINEMSCTVAALDYDPEAGTLKQIQTIATLPRPVKAGDSTADVHVHPSGKFLYGSNRGHDSIAIFAIDASTGRLTAVGHQPTGGKTPRNFGIDPTGAYLLAANQDSDTIVPFRIDARTGRLTPTGQTLAVPKPVCVKFIAED